MRAERVGGGALSSGDRTRVWVDFSLGLKLKNKQNRKWEIIRLRGSPPIGNPTEKPMTG